MQSIFFQSFIKYKHIFIEIIFIEMIWTHGGKKKYNMKYHIMMDESRKK